MKALRFPSLICVIITLLETPGTNGVSKTVFKYDQHVSVHSVMPYTNLPLKVCENLFLNHVSMSRGLLHEHKTVCQCLNICSYFTISHFIQNQSFQSDSCLRVMPLKKQII